MTKGLVTDTEFDDEQVRRVITSVDRAIVRSWDGRVRREALLGLAATAVLEVLPDDHAARPPLLELADRGASHLPS